MQRQESTLLIIGHGYLGNCYRCQFAPDYTAIQVTCRSAGKVKTLRQAGVDAYQVDVNDRSSWDNLPVPRDTRLRICLFITPRDIDCDALAGFVRRLQHCEIDAVVMTSSSVVYGNAERQVDSDSEVLLDSDRAQRQYNIEQVTGEEFPAAGIIRLAGLYGPDRIIGQKSLRENRLLRDAPDGWLNLIHVEDAATLVHAALDRAGPFQELGCDGQPLKRDEYYQQVARWLGTAEPRFQGARDGTGRGRRCSNHLTRKRLSWTPRYSSFSNFIEARGSTASRVGDCL